MAKWYDTTSAVELGVDWGVEYSQTSSINLKKKTWREKFDTKNRK